MSELRSFLKRLRKFIDEELTTAQTWDDAVEESKPRGKQVELTDQNRNDLVPVDCLVEAVADNVAYLKFTKKMQAHPEGKTWKRPCVPLSQLPDAVKKGDQGIRVPRWLKAKRLEKEGWPLDC